ncbi:hypothetical protein L8P05_10560 [Enterobacter cloacae]|uniref:hypothetical protein n=1 Tax=Enterobacter cloacae TaxID=550 RepID=UPI0020047BCC|nr:hypothetical protein [Enterobacter cloacae]MCK7174365.1 hypothetical protein [Enterobacter cloacae]
MKMTNIIAINNPVSYPCELFVYTTMENQKMKKPISMLEDIAAEITENTSLLEVIHRINEFSPEADNAIACLIRSMNKTCETAYAYVEQFSNEGEPK